MTKLLYCQPCGDMVLPHEPMVPRACRCRRHHAWWDAERRRLSVFDAHAAKSAAGVPEVPKAFVVLIHNAVLSDPADMMSRETIEGVLNQIPDDRTLNDAHSLVTKFRPGMTSDTSWASGLPESRPGAPLRRRRLPVPGERPAKRGPGAPHPRGEP